MGIIISNDLNRLQLHLKHSARILQPSVDKIVKEATKTGANEMRRIIETSGTGWVGKWFTATAQGRVDTGYMLSNVSESFTKRSGSWGWGLNGGKVEPYFVFQNYGFHHYISGKQVPGMNALLGSFLKAREQLIRDLDELVK